MADWSAIENNISQRRGDKIILNDGLVISVTYLKCNCELCDRIPIPRIIGYWNTEISQFEYPPSFLTSDYPNTEVEFRPKFGDVITGMFSL